MSRTRSSSWSSDDEAASLRRGGVDGVLRDFDAGVRSLHDAVGAVKVCLQSRRTSNGDWFPVKTLFRLSEERLFELLQALIQDCPHFPTVLINLQVGTVLHLALGAEFGPYAVSTRVLLLLCTPEVTRISGAYYHLGVMMYRGFPLHMAAAAGGVHEEVIDRLIDLDPDVLMKMNSKGALPLHLALDAMSPLPASALHRMMERRPLSLLERSWFGHTPVSLALECCDDPSPDIAALVARWVARFPASLLPPGTERLMGVDPPGSTPLRSACENFHRHPDLVRAVVEADPASLGVASGYHSGVGRMTLPFEVVRAETGPGSELTRFVEDETLHLALAVAEAFAVGGSGDVATSSSQEDVKGGGGAAFQRHLRETVARFVKVAVPEPAMTPPPRSCSPERQRKKQRAPPKPSIPSAFAVTQSIRALTNRMEFCRDLFLRRPNCKVQWANDEFRQAVLGDSVVTLYLLNHRDRSDPTPTHQVQLLASVSDSLDCLYLQFREHGNRLLLQFGS